MQGRDGIAAALFVLSATMAADAQPAAGADAQGKIVALNGRVEHTRAAQEQWIAARMLQPLLVAERVRTLEASRASILFVDETQVKLNAGAVLTVRQVRTATGPSSSMDLQRGEAWFRTKNPRSGLTIQTPAAAAAIRGTEINVRIGGGGETVLTVVEGAAEFSNPQGAILVNAGEEGTALPGQAPTKRVVLNPEDAVQWTLYYPVQLADLGVAAGATADADTIALTSAIAALESGDAAAARRQIETVLSRSATNAAALVLLSTIELRGNRAAAASAAAARALAAQPESVAALVAASEAAQAQFDLAAALG